LLGDGLGGCGHDAKFHSTGKLLGLVSISYRVLQDITVLGDYEIGKGAPMTSGK